MTKRLTAAFAALLVSLAGLPLIAADPVSAHTQTVRRCAYDPFAGQQCWNEAVAHVHPPNNYSPPPDTRTRADQEAARKRQEAKRKADEAERTRQAAEAARKAAKDDTSDNDDTSGNDDTPEDTSTTPDNDDTPEDTSTTPDNDDTPGNDDTSGNDDTPEDTTPEDTTPDNDDEPSGDNEPSRTQPKKSTTATTPDLCRGPERRNHHDHGGTVDCHSRGHAPDGHGHGAPSGGSDLGKVWAAIKKAVNKVQSANGEAALSDAEIRAKFGKDVVAAFKTAMQETDYTSMGGGIPVAGAPIEAEQVRKVAKAAGTHFLAQWDKMSPTEKLAMQTAFCGLVTATTGIGGVGCGIAVGLAEIYVPRPEQSAAPDGDSTPDDTTPDGDSTPREGGTAAARPTPDSTPDSTPDDNNQGDAAPETTISHDQLRKANEDRNKGLISIEELRRLQNRYRCQIGYQQYC